MRVTELTTYLTSPCISQFLQAGINRLVLKKDLCRFYKDDRGKKEKRPLSRLITVNHCPFCSRYPVRSGNWLFQYFKSLVALPVSFSCNLYSVYMHFDCEAQARYSKFNIQPPHSCYYIYQPIKALIKKKQKCYSTAKEV